MLYYTSIANLWFQLHHIHQHKPLQMHYLQRYHCARHHKPSPYPKVQSFELRVQRVYEGDGLGSSVWRRLAEYTVPRVGVQENLGGGGHCNIRIKGNNAKVSFSNGKMAEGLH